MGLLLRSQEILAATADDYWLKHNNQSDDDVGEWVETVEPGSS